MIVKLDITPRDATRSLEDIRAEGGVPAVYYGPKESATPIAIDGRKLASVWKEAGETTIITLTGAGEDKDTLIKDVQTHPVTGAVLHADFYVLEKGKKIEIAIPLEFEGQAPAEKAGHIISKALHEIEIEVAPAELPQHLVVDVTTLANVGDHITAAQVKLPPSATLITDPEEIVASVTEHVDEKEAPAAPAEGEAPAEGAAAAEATPAEDEAKSE